jgi:hypothetical protein
MIPVSLTADGISRSVWTLKVNPFTGKVRVRWFKSPLTEYQYKCSKRAIVALLIAGDRSYGQWVNWHCYAA